MERLRTSRWQRKISTTTPHAKFSDSIGSVKFPSDQWWYWNHLKSMGSPLFLGSKGTWSLLIAQCRNNAEMSTVKLQSEYEWIIQKLGTIRNQHVVSLFNLFLTSIRLSSTIDYRHAFGENIWLQTLYHVTETLTSESDTNYCSMVSQQLLW